MAEHGITDGMMEHYMAAAKQFGIPYTDLNAEYVEGIQYFSKLIWFSREKNSKKYSKL